MVSGPCVSWIWCGGVGSDVGVVLCCVVLRLMRRLWRRYYCVLPGRSMQVIGGDEYMLY